MKGRDNRVRHAAVHAALLLALMVLAGLFYGLAISAAVVSIAACVATVISFATSRRRLRDAGRPLSWAAAVGSGWLLFALVHGVWAGAGWSWWLLLLPIGGAVVLAVLPEHQGRATLMRTWGYAGPQTDSLQTTANMMAQPRVEPSIDGETTAQPIPSEVPHAPHDWDAPVASTWSWSLPQMDLHALWQRLRPYWRHLAAGAAGLVMVFVAIVGLRQPAQPLPSDVEVAQTTVSEPSFDHQVDMPDSYQLQLLNDGVIVRWPGSANAQGEIWSLLTAQGDRSCQVARFNNGTEYRPVKVEVWGDDVYYAYLSPLDTAAFIYDVAMRGNFKLCGYDFSLRGSMDTLRADPAFALYTRQR
ncbi:hypothetical protein [Ferrimonas pelagia]